MGQDYTEDNLMIERYLRDELSAEEAAAFEEAYLGSGELLDELETAERLEQGLRDLAALEKPQQRTKGLSWMPSIFQSPQYAMAASFLLVISLGVTGILYHRVTELDGPMNMAAATIMPLVSVRGGPGAEPVNIVTLEPESEVFVFMLDPGFEPFSHFRATMVRVAPDGSQRTILQADRMQPGYEDMLALSVPASLLTPGDFEVKVEGWREDLPPNREFAPVSTLSLRVEAAD